MIWLAIPLWLIIVLLALILLKLSYIGEVIRAGQEEE